MLHIIGLLIRVCAWGVVCMYICVCNYLYIYVCVSLYYVRLANFFRRIEHCVAPSDVSGFFALIFKKKNVFFLQKKHGLCFFCFFLKNCIGQLHLQFLEFSECASHFYTILHRKTSLHNRVDAGQLDTTDFTLRTF